MLNFIDELKSYIKNSFDNDERFEQEITVCDAYKSNLIKCPKIVVYCVDDIDDQQYTTFEGERISSLSIQITCYAEQMKIEGIVKSAQECANIFSEKIRNDFQINTIAFFLNSVKSVRRVGRTYAIPFDSGERMYMSPLRFEIQVEN